MREKTTTNIIFESSYTVIDNNGKSLTIDASTRGGEATATIIDIPNLSENYVVIDPNHGASVGTIFEVTQEYYNHRENGTFPDPNGQPLFIVNENVTSNTAISTMHGIGHVI